MDLPAAPERFGVFISERSSPTLGHRELAPHGSKGRSPAFPHGYQLRDGAAVPLDDHGLAVLDQVEQLRELGLRAMDADVHGHSSVHFLD
jgi:hypothetical protein